MHVKLERYSYSMTETEGELLIRKDGRTYSFATIERPWMPNPNGARGGKPMESCVPDGAYVLSPWTRPNGDEVYILYSPDLGVWREPDEHEPDRGRNLCLIHSANFANEVNGCIAPGMIRTFMHGRPAVGSSRYAMRSINELLGRERSHVLYISNETGASDVTV